MTKEKFSIQDTAHLMIQCQQAIGDRFIDDCHFSADVTDINSHFDEDTGLMEINLKVKFDKVL